MATQDWRDAHRIDNLESELAHLRKKVASRGEWINTLRDARDGLIDRAGKAENQVHVLTAERDAARARAEKVEKERDRNAQVEARAKEAEDCAARAWKDRGEALQRLEVAEREVERLRRERNEQAEAADKAEKEAEWLRNSLKIKHEAYADTLDERIQIARQLGWPKNAGQPLKADLARLVDSNNKLIELLTQERDGAEERTHKAGKEIYRLKKSLSAAQEEVEWLRKKPDVPTRAQVEAALDHDDWCDSYGNHQDCCPEKKEWGCGCIVRSHINTMVERDWLKVRDGSQA